MADPFADFFLIRHLEQCLPHSKQWKNYLLNVFLSHEEPFVLYILYLVLASSLVVFLCGMIFISSLMIITQFPVILNCVRFYTRM